MHSQPVGSVTGTRTPLDTCHRESGETIELAKARLCKCDCHILRDTIICATLAGGTGQGLNQEAPTSPWARQERLRARKEPSAEGNVWFTERWRGKGENQAKCHKFRSSKEKEVCVSCGETLRGEEKLREDSAGWWDWGEGSCPLLLGIKTNSFNTPLGLAALLERPQHLARERSWDQRLGCTVLVKMQGSDRGKLQAAEKWQQSEL